MRRELLFDHVVAVQIREQLDLTSHAFVLFVTCILAGCFPERVLTSFCRPFYLLSTDYAKHHYAKNLYAKNLLCEKFYAKNRDTVSSAARHACPSSRPMSARVGRSLNR